MSLSSLLSKIASYPVRLVEITGGEPLEQEEVYPLMDALLDRGYTVMLETGGHVDIQRVPKLVIKIPALERWTNQFPVAGRNTAVSNSPSPS